MTRRASILVSLAAVGLLAACTVDRAFRPGPGHLVAQPRPAASGGGQAPDSLLIVSYNIQYGEDLATALVDLRTAGLDRPDILLLQEMTPAGVDTLARALDMAYVYQPASVHPHHQQLFGNAVLSRWPITANRLLVLPHPHPWSGHRRIAIACDLDVGGRPVRAVSVHLATPVLPADQRLAQAVAVVDSLVEGWDGPVVVGGDFNTLARADIAAVRKAYRRTARLLPARLPPGGTVRWHPGRLVGAGATLDHVFVRGLPVGSAGVARAATASDHFPLWIRCGIAGRP